MTPHAPTYSSAPAEGDRPEAGAPVMDWNSSFAWLGDCPSPEIAAAVVLLLPGQSAPFEDPFLESDLDGSFREILS